jgi:hypothetical protein
MTTSFVLLVLRVSFLVITFSIPVSHQYDRYTNGRIPSHNCGNSGSGYGRDGEGRVLRIRTRLCWDYPPYSCCRPINRPTIAVYSWIAWRKAPRIRTTYSLKGGVGKYGFALTVYPLRPQTGRRSGTPRRAKNHRFFVYHPDHNWYGASTN